MRAPLTAALVCLALASPAAAEPVAIANSGFEALYLGSNLPPEYGGDVPTGTFPTGPAPTGWTEYTEFGVPVAGAFYGVLNPGVAADYAPDPSFFPAGAPEGDNAVLLYMSGDAGGDEFGVEQTLGPVLEAGIAYTLSVEVGNIASATALLPPYSGQGFYDLQGFPGYRLQLLAGGVVVAEDTASVSPGEGVFERAALVFVADSGHPQLGQALGVRVVNRNEPDVAGVTGLEVDFDDVRLDASPAVPVLPGVAALALGAALLGLGARRIARS